jgi:hypothetical protein
MEVSSTNREFYNFINESKIDQEIIFWLDIEMPWKCEMLKYQCKTNFSGYRIIINNEDSSSNTNVCFLTSSGKYYVAIDVTYNITQIYDGLTKSIIKIKEANVLIIERKICNKNIKEYKNKIQLLLSKYKFNINNKFLLFILQKKIEKNEFRLQQIIGKLSIVLCNYIRINDI